MSPVHPRASMSSGAPLRRLVGWLGAAALAVGSVVAWPSPAATAPHTDRGWSTDVTASSVRAEPGDTITFTVTAASSQGASALVDLEVYDASWRKVLQHAWPHESFRAGTARTFAVNWTVPADVRGELRVKLGIFAPGWGVLHHWNDDPLRLHIEPATTPTSPPTTSPPTTSPPTTSPPTTAPPTTVPPTTTTPPTTAPAPTTVPPATTTPATTPATPSGSQFAASFESAADFYGRFQLDVHFRDDAHVDWGRVFPGDHDMSCGAPTSQRAIHLQPDVDGANRSLEKSELFWWCAPGGDTSKGHIMTGMADVDGYTILSFAPNRAFTNITQVCWDVNLTDLGGRKWTQVLVVPEDVFQANGRRLDYISPITQDVDRTAIPLPAGSFMWQTWDHKARLFQGQHELHFDWSSATTDDKARRYRHCMTDNGDGTITTTQERDGAPRTITVRGSFPDHGRVIFQDDNYTPEKDAVPQGFTWHWDNVVIR